MQVNSINHSDKIARWNVLGLLGSLLCSFVNPIYLESLVVGELFDEFNLSRSLNDRLVDVEIQVGSRFRINRLKILPCTTQFPSAQYYLAKTSLMPTVNFYPSISWFHAGKVEVTTNGRKLGSRCKDGIWHKSSRSRVSKMMIWKACNDMKIARCGKQATYFDAKNACNDYRELRNVINSTIFKGWIVNSKEYESFKLPDEDAEQCDS